MRSVSNSYEEFSKCLILVEVRAFDIRPRKGTAGRI